MTRRKRAIQEHHISRDPEVTAMVFKGEHGVLTRMQWWCRGEVSKGFIKSLKVWIALNEDKAVEL